MIYNETKNRIIDEKVDIGSCHDILFWWIMYDSARMQEFLDQVINLAKKIG